MRRKLFFAILFITSCVKAGNYDWFRTIQFSQRNHKVTGIATDGQNNIIVSGNFLPCMLCTRVGFLAGYDSLSVYKWGVTASTFGVYPVEFSRPFTDAGGNIYTSIYIPAYALNGPQLNIGSTWIGGPDSTGYLVLLRFLPEGALSWYQVIASTKPMVHCADNSGNSYFSNGDTTWKYSNSGALLWQNNFKGGAHIVTSGSDVYVGNGNTVDRLGTGTGNYLTTWTLPDYLDLEAASGGVIYGTGNSGSFKVTNGVIQFQQASFKGVGISRRNTDLWIIENNPLPGGTAGSIVFRKLSTSSGSQLSSQTITDAQTNGTRGNIAIDASGSLLLTFDGFDGAPYSYIKLAPWILWRDYSNYESVFLVKFRTKFLTPVLGFSNSVWTNGEFGVDNWNSVEIGAAKPCADVNKFNVGYGLKNASFSVGDSVIVELSDSNGTFMNPLIIGSKITVATSGTVNCNIPYSLPNGPNYRIRLRTSNPALLSVQESYSVGIYAPKSTLISSGPLTFCSKQTGTEIVSVYDNPAYTVLWQINETVNTSLIGNSISPAASGSYSTLVTDFDGCIRRSENDIPVTVWPLPKVTVNPSGSIQICKGAQAMLKASSATAQSYQWFKYSNALSGANDSNYTAGTTGYYRVVVSDSNGCSRTSSTVKLSVYSATVTEDGPLSFCQGDSVVLTGPSVNTAAYQWQLNGTNIPGATTVEYVAKTPGNYTVLTTSNAGCTAVSPAKVVAIICREGMESAPAFVVFPNPVVDQLFIEWKSLSAAAVLELSDISGRLLYRSQAPAAEQIQRIDMEFFNPGLYMLRITLDNGIYENIRIVKQ